MGWWGQRLHLCRQFGLDFMRCDLLRRCEWSGSLQKRRHWWTVKSAVWDIRSGKHPNFCNNEVCRNQSQVCTFYTTDVKYAANTLYAVCRVCPIQISISLHITLRTDSEHGSSMSTTTNSQIDRHRVHLLQMSLGKRLQTGWNRKQEDDRWEWLGQDLGADKEQELSLSRGRKVNSTSIKLFE